MVHVVKLDQYGIKETIYHDENINFTQKDLCISPYYKVYQS